MLEDGDPGDSEASLVEASSLLLEDGDPGDSEARLVEASSPPARGW